jgi:hypothetical protein
VQQQQQPPQPPQLPQQVVVQQYQQHLQIPRDVSSWLLWLSNVIKDEMIRSHIVGAQ